VVAAEHGSPSAGNWIAVEHSGGLVTRYLHLSRIDVKKGQQVSKGQQFGATGNTGASAGPHLHFDAFVPEAKIATYDSLFTRPESGYTKSGLGFGVKVPVEPLIPVDSYSDAIIKYSMTHQLPLRGGAGRWLALAGVGAVGFILWKNRAAIRRRLGQ
jgi:murein DD-endopeptidase MepM/ murein hydrolase activator NlpD